jgi:hypothetical protein
MLVKYAHAAADSLVIIVAGTTDQLEVSRWILNKF